MRGGGHCQGLPRQPAREEGWACRPGWAARGGRRQRRQGQAEGAGPGRERLAETDKGNPETVNGRDTVRKRETRKVEEDKCGQSLGDH